MNRDALVALIERDEGVRLKPYVDTAGKLTIGVGRNLTDVGLSPAEVRFLLQNDLDACLADLDPLPWFQALSDVRQRVVVSMRFNLGMAGLLKFKRMLVALELGRYTAAAREMLQSDWARQVGLRADRLATMMITDQEV